MGWTSVSEISSRRFQDGICLFQRLRPACHKQEITLPECEPRAVVEVIPFIGRWQGGEEREGLSLGCVRSFSDLQQEANLFPFRSQEHFVRRFPNWERPQQGWPEVFLPDPDPGPALRARQLGQPAQPSLRLCPTARWDKASSLFAAEDPPFSSTLEAEVEEKNVEPCKMKRRFCRGNAEKPEQKPSLHGQSRDLLTDHWLCYPNVLLCYPQAIPLWLSTSFKRV